MEITSPPDIDATRTLLEAARLPTADVTPVLIEHFIGAVNGGVLQGAIGYESFGDIGLLRSLVVSPDARGLGLGTRLVLALEEKVRRTGIGSLYLLTTDADRYFEKHGYAIVDRSSVPDVIRGTAQYSTLCPGTATVMSKRLSQAG